MVYRRRIVDDLLDSVFIPGGLAAVALEGAKGVGKTATGTQRASTVLTLTAAGEREALAANVPRIAALGRLRYLSFLLRLADSSLYCCLPLGLGRFHCRRSGCLRVGFDLPGPVFCVTDCCYRLK